MFPKSIGSRITLPAGDNELRRFAEWHGFSIESGTGQTYVMRRDFRAGVFGPKQQPDCPASIRHVRTVH